MAARRPGANRDRWAPLPFPFTTEVAHAYIEHAHQERRTSGALQLAITSNGLEPLGEVLAFGGGRRDEVELAYAIGDAAGSPTC